ncbi:WD40 repeat domain-containing protein [Streptomyces sp. NPDC056464]|uniref:WD40 repeat domain-containing protein n=1 Tax=Streptomyces sp. NPDC056464 TaxID=3345828 RepID=UPI0036A58DD8
MGVRTIEQVVSRYHPILDVPNLRMGFGRDGFVYLVIGGRPDGRALRLRADGSEQTFARAGYAAQAITADAGGVIATADAHFPHRITFWDTDFNELGHYDEFTADDDAGYFSPGGVEAAERGGFYAIDQHARRVLKLGPGGLDRPIPLTGLPPDLPDSTISAKGTVGLRVAEGADRLYTAWPSSAAVPGGFISAATLDGVQRWSLPGRVSGLTLSAFDASENGWLHVVFGGGREHKVVVYDQEGQQRRTVPIEPVGGDHVVQDLRIRDGKYFVKRSDPRFLFETYDAATGERLGAVDADVEKLTVAYGSERHDADVWTAGAAMPLTVTHSPGRWADKPHFRVWLRPLGVPEFTELPLSGGTVTPPADTRGLYQLRVTPDVAGRQTEYVVDGMIEIRPPGEIKGSLSILTYTVDESITPPPPTPKVTGKNRFYYGRGEPLLVKIVAKSAPGTPLPGSVRVKVLRDGAVVGEPRDVTLTGGGGELRFDADFTLGLEPGRYVIDADPQPGFTVAPQYLEIGQGLVRRPEFHLTWYSDIYASRHASFPVDPRDVIKDSATQLPPRPVDAPDTIEAHLARAEALGLNLFVDRLGALGWSTHLVDGLVDADLAKRLDGDPKAVSALKADVEDTARRTLAGYGARGMEEQAVLLQNDTYLPLDWPKNHENRDETELKAEIRKVTLRLRPYAALRGWTWGANWWLAQHGAGHAKDEDERGKYTVAAEKAQRTGEWSPVLDTVTDRAFAYKTDLGDHFRGELNTVAPALISAMTAPYREPQCPPQIIFASADEVDLHYQGEQAPAPLTSAHMVDFYRRAGKPAWGHPELFNDDGTGGMILPTLFLQAMRGPDGTGMVGDAGAQHIEGILDYKERGGGSGSKPGDPRAGGAGKMSVLRAAFDLIARLGPAIAGAENANRVAIVVSTRMLRLETYHTLASIYFLRLYEAYAACLHAHRPASFLFAEDADPETLRRYEAVLLVGQTVDLDPGLELALREVHAPPPASPADPMPPGKVTVYADGTCLAKYRSVFHPLHADADADRVVDPDEIVSFNRVQGEQVVQSDDTAYHRLRRAFLDQAAAVGKALVRVPPVAECDSPEVLLSEWRAGNVTYIWAVNNTMLDWEPGLAWRVGLICAQRIPVRATLRVRLPALHHVVDVLTGKRVSLLGGEFTADLRTVPARLYAIVPLLHDPLPSASEEAFGPHARDVALSADGRTAMVNAFNWDHDLYGLDLATGRTRWRQRIGHHFAYAPAARPQGFAAQGFDVHAPEGYHLYLLDAAGTPERRFALFGLPKKATDWAKSEWGYDYGLNNFALAPGGSWVATSGDLGLAVWDRAGRERWTHEWWAQNRRVPLRLLALDDDTLITFAENTISALSAADGTTLWSLDVAGRASLGGTFNGGAVSGDRRTAVIWSEADGGRVYVIRGGRLLNTLPTAASEVSVSADGSFLVVTSRNQLKAFDTERGLLWTYTGDDLLRRPRVSPDGTRVAVGSELGTLSVLKRDGALLAATDLRALPVPTWLPGGDLLVATWMGTVIRYRGAGLADLREVWRTRLVPQEEDIRPKLSAPDQVPVVRRAGWGNAPEHPLELTPNLIADTHAFFDIRMINPTIPMTPQNDFGLLTDGSAEPPPRPWLNWTVLNGLGHNRDNEFVFTVDTLRTQVRLTGITFAEDPAHPESWLRDVLLQWWDTERGLWRDGPMLLSDRAVHRHPIDPPIESARFRFVTTGGGAWPAGNLRLGALVFHGEVLGNSHRDVLQPKPLAVLFDEREDDLRDLVLGEPGSRVVFQHGDAYSGTRCVRLNDTVERHPLHPNGFFGHAVHDWDFEIVEHPAGPGQYRYFQFAWRALGPQTGGIGLRIGPPWPSPAVAVTVGDSVWRPDSVMALHRVPGAPPATWTTVRLDLWQLTGGRLARVRSLSLRSDGGGALFDQLVLGRTEADLPPPPA